MLPAGSPKVGRNDRHPPLKAKWPQAAQPCKPCRVRTLWIPMPPIAVEEADRSSAKSLHTTSHSMGQTSDVHNGKQRKYGSLYRKTSKATSSIKAEDEQPKPPTKAR